MDRTMFSAQVDGPVTYWDSAEDLIALMDHLGIASAVLVGMSQGGYLSIRAALAHPERVGGLVVIDSGVWMDDPETLAGYEGMLAHWASDAPLGEVGQMVAGLILGEPTLMEKWIAIWESRDRTSITYPGQALLGRDDVTGRVDEITCPVLIVHSTDDLAIPIATAEQLCAEISDCRGMIPVPGAAHASNMTDPEVVNPALENFLAGLTS